MKRILTSIVTSGIAITGLAAAETTPQPSSDTPTPLQLNIQAGNLRKEANDLAKKFRAASKGKKWGASPGHKALYQSMFAYRNELATITEMCKPAESPERLLKIILNSQELGKKMEQLAQFVVIPEEITKLITATSQKSPTLEKPLAAYEARYFKWKKTALSSQHKKDLARLRNEVVRVARNQDQLRNENETLRRTVQQQENKPPVIIVREEPRQCPYPPQQAQPQPRPRPRPCPPAQPQAPTRRVSPIEGLLRR